MPGASDTPQSNPIRYRELRSAYAAACC
jgi:hypothetical protein